MSKKFERPEDLSTLSADDIVELRAAAAAERDEIAATEGDFSTEQLDRLESLMTDIDDLDARGREIETEAAALAERQEAARARVAGQDQVEEPAVEAVEAVEEPAVEVADEAVVEEVPEPESVLASAAKRNTVAIAAKGAPAVIIKKETPVEEPSSLTTITAAANVPEFNAGQKLDGMQDVAQAFLQRSAGFGQNDADMEARVFQMSPNASRHGVARIKRAEREFTVDRNMSIQDQFDVIMAASKEKNLAGGSLLAAGGWCSPSETMYDFCEMETTDGLFDIAEVTARRGGISFTKGPDLSTLLADANFGFTQTETQAEAGTEKPCYAVACPPFTEVRLDAIGFCITAGLLTNAAYPELVRRTLNLAGIGHAYRKSATTIARISTLIGAAVTYAAVGAAGSQSGAADSLAALELQALRIRQTHALSPGTTIDGVAPIWFRAALRSDLSRRLGLPDPMAVTDADIDRYLAIRGIRLQFVYGYQALVTGATTTPGGTAGWTSLPGQVEIMLWPAGAYVRLVNDVISLDAVYDHDMLIQNTYTAAFMEEGLAVANTCGTGVKLNIALNYEGSAGYPAIGTGVGISVPAAV